MVGTRRCSLPFTIFLACLYNIDLFFFILQVVTPCCGVLMCFLCKSKGWHFECTCSQVKLFTAVFVCPNDCILFIVLCTHPVYSMSQVRVPCCVLRRSPCCICSCTQASFFGAELQQRVRGATEPSQTCPMCKIPVGLPFGCKSCHVACVCGHEWWYSPEQPLQEERLLSTAFCSTEF